MKEQKTKENLAGVSGKAAIRIQSNCITFFRRTGKQQRKNTVLYQKKQSF